MAEELPDAPWVAKAPELPDAPWASEPEPADHGFSERRKLSAVGKTLSPITSFPETYSRMNREARETLSRGTKQITEGEGLWDTAKGVGNVALGSLGYVGSPINAAYRSVVGQPVEDVTGVPREYTEFAAQLATPGLGLTRVGAPKPGAPIGPSELQPRVAGRAPVDEARYAEELNIPLTRGQATRDSDAIRYEDMAARGAYGPGAQVEAKEFFENQFERIGEAGRNVSGQLARTGTQADEPLTAAGNINAEIAERANMAQRATTGAERVAESEAAAQRAMAADRQAAIDEAVRGGRPALETREAGEVIGEELRGEAARRRGLFKGLYKEAFEKPGEFGVGTFEGIGNRIRVGMTYAENPVIVDDTTPIAARALQDLDNVQNLQFKNLAEPGARSAAELEAAGMPVMAVNLRGVDQARKLLVARYTQARNAARSTQNFSDQRAMERIIDEFDDHLERSIANGLFSGDHRALQALQEARKEFSQYRRNFRRNAGDDVSNAISRIVERNATPEEIANMVIGSGRLGNAGLPVRLADRLENLLGADSEAWNAVRQGVWNRASTVRAAATGEVDAARSANQLLEFTQFSLARRVFAPEELTAMRSHARGVKELDQIIEQLPATQKAQRARAAYQEFFEPQLEGAQATVFRQIIEGRATPEQTANAIFGAVNSQSSGNVSRMLRAIERVAGRDSETMAAIRQGVWQRMTRNAPGKDQPGAQRMAQAISEFLNGNGRTIAQQLYTPEERELMRKYSEAIRLTVPDRYSRTAPDTAPALLAAMNKLGTAISSSLGSAFSHIPVVGPVLNYGISKLLEKAQTGVKDMKELNRIRSHLEPPSAIGKGPVGARPRITVHPSKALALPATPGILSQPPRLPAKMFSGQGTQPAAADDKKDKARGGRTNQPHKRGNDQKHGQDSNDPSNVSGFPGARKGRDGSWYIADENRPGKYLKVTHG